MTTMRVTKRQARAIQAYTDSHADVSSAAEALDDLGVADLDAHARGMGALPIQERLDELEDRVEEHEEKLSGPVKQMLGDLKERVEDLENQ